MKLTTHICKIALTILILFLHLRISHYHITIQERTASVVFFSRGFESKTNRPFLGGDIVVKSTFFQF